MSDEPKTDRVRVLVGLSLDGSYTAAGGSGESEADLPQDIYDTMMDVARWAWIEANVPLPVAQTIKGTVTVIASGSETITDPAV